VKKHLLAVGIIFFLSSFIPISQGYNVNISYDIEQCSIQESNGYIQNLIDEASDGDTIYIPSGTYYENIVIDKTINLIGEDKDTTVIDGRGRGNVVHISANWVNITGFKICDAYIEDAGVAIYSNYNIITGNNILDSLDDYAKGVGIYSNYNIITGNNISNNYIGIDIGGSNNTITGNNISNNDYHGGIRLYYSSNNTITDNNISNNRYGIDVDKSSSNTITDNTISNNGEGIFLYSSNNNNILGNSFFNDGLFVSESYDKQCGK
jgi:parallel beta-helix repeat protein